MFEAPLHLTAMTVASQATTGLLSLQTGHLHLGSSLLQPLQNAAEDQAGLGQTILEALPYVAVTGLAAGAVAGATILALRLWRRRQAALPPPGTTAIPPERLSAFFRQLDAADLRMLSLTEEAIASEIEDLTKGLEGNHNAKMKDLLEKAREAYRDIGDLVALRDGRTVQARNQLAEDPAAVLKSTAQGLSRLRNFRLLTTTQYFQTAHHKRSTKLPASDIDEAVALYNDLNDSKRKELFGLADRVWQALPIEDKDFFWGLRQKGDDLRGPSLPADFLVTFARLLSHPTFPLKNVAVLAGALTERVHAFAREMQTGPALPKHFRNVNGGILILRNGQRKYGNVEMSRSLGMTTVVLKIKDTSNAKPPEVLEFAPEDVLTIIGPEKEEECQPYWTHPDVSLKDDGGKTARGIVADLSAYPAHSLGTNHSVLVSFADPKLTTILEKLAPLRDKLNSGEAAPERVVRKIWEALKKRGTEASPAQIADATGSGTLHSLTDVVQAGGSLERAILFQVIFQFLGIPSRLEQGALKVLFTNGQAEPEWMAATEALWVRVQIPGRPEAILCPRVDEPLEPDHPVFEAFQDQTPESAPHTRPSAGSVSSESGTHAVHNAPPPEDDDLEDEFADRPTLVMARPASEGTPSSDDSFEPTAAMHPDEEATRQVSLRDLRKNAAAAADQASPHEEVTRQVSFEKLKEEGLKQSLIQELGERYKLLSSDDPAALQIATKLSLRIYEAWKEAGCPALEADEDGVPLRIPEIFIERVVEAWTRKLQKTGTDVARKLLAEMIDLGNRAERTRAETAVTMIPPPAEPEFEEQPIPLMQPARKTPPPMPTAEELEARALEEILSMARRRYPVFRERTYDGLAEVIARKVYQAAGADPTLRYGKLTEIVDGLIPTLENNPAHQTLLTGLRGTDAILSELQERYPDFTEAMINPLLPEALLHVFRFWQIRRSKLETGPDGRWLIPEDVLEAGFDNFRAMLPEAHPEIDPETFNAAFIENDQRRRSVRWAPSAEEPIEEREDIVTVDPDIDHDIEVGSIRPPSQPAPRETSRIQTRPDPSTPAERISGEIEARYPELAPYASLVTLAAKKAAPETFASEDEVRRATDEAMAQILRGLANMARSRTPLESLLRGIIQRDVINELRDSYSVFREKEFEKLTEMLAERIYGIWDGHNRTFNGTADALPLRIPEKFVSEGLERYLFAQLRSGNRALHERIVASYQGSRSERETRRSSPAKSGLPPIPISEHNVQLEMLDRFPTLRNHDRLARLLARDIYAQWLIEDPGRTLERSGAGLRGLVPESVIERRLALFYDKMDAMGLQTLRRQLQNEGKPRALRGTAVLEFDIRDAHLSASHNAA